MIIDPKALFLIGMNEDEPQESKQCEHDFKRMKDPRKMKCRKCGIVARYSSARVNAPKN